MNIDKLLQIVEKELNARNVYKDAHDALMDIKGLAQLKGELTDKVAKLTKEIGITKTDLEAQHERLLETNASITKAEMIAEAIVKEAKEEAKKREAEAKSKAEKIGLTKEAELQSLEAAIADANLLLSKTRSEIDEANDTLEKIHKAIGKAKDTVVSIFGG